MINIPKFEVFDREQIYNLIVARYIFRESFRNLTPDGKDFNKIRREANIFAVQNTNHWFLNQHEIKEW